VVAVGVTVVVDCVTVPVGCLTVVVGCVTVLVACVTVWVTVFGGCVTVLVTVAALGAPAVEVVVLVLVSAAYALTPAARRAPAISARSDVRTRVRGEDRIGCLRAAYAGREGSDATGRLDARCFRVGSVGHEPTGLQLSTRPHNARAE
jgi:hypothetical protein